MKNRVSDDINNIREALEDLKNSDLQMELASALVDRELERCEKRIKIYSIVGLITALLSLTSLLLTNFVDLNFVIPTISCLVASLYFSLEVDIEKVKRSTILTDQFTSRTIMHMHEMTVAINKTKKKEKK